MKVNRFLFMNWTILYAGGICLYLHLQIASNNNIITYLYINSKPNEKFTFFNFKGLSQTKLQFQCFNFFLNGCSLR